MYLDALKNAPGGPMPPNPATQGLGAPPSMPGLPPPPTGVGAMPMGTPTTTKMSAGADAIAALRSLQGFVPQMNADINEMISRIKNALSPKKGQNAGPALGEPGVPGAAQMDSSPLMDSGGPGAM